MITESNNLDNFGGWGQSPDDTDFFSQQEEGTEISTETKDVLEKVLEDENKGTVKDPKHETEVSEEKDLFSEESNENLEEEKDEDEKEVVNESPNIFILNKLKEKGFIDYKLEEGEELTEELAEELIEEKFDESVDAKVDELMKELPDSKKQIISYLIKGGNVEELISTLSSGGSGLKMDIDLEKEENQISAMKELLKLEDKDDEEIETEIEFLKDSGKLKAMAEKKFGKYKTEFEKNQRKLVEQQTKQKETEKELIKEAKQKVVTFLTTNAKDSEISFSKDDVKQLPSFMNDKNVKLQNGTTITEMQKVLFYDLPKNDKAFIQLATLLKNRNEDGTFNFTSIEKSSKTKVTQEVRNNIRNNKTSIPGSSTTKSKENNKSLFEYFN